MITDVLMSFSKSTKRTTVFATDDDLAPVDNAYVNTAELLLHDITGDTLTLSISKAPFTTEEAENFPIIIPMRISRTTKRKTLFKAVNADAPVDRLYVTSEWLLASDFGDTLYLGISPTAGDDTNRDDTNVDDDEDPDNAFDEFLATTIIRSEGGLVNTDRIWAAWALVHSADPECDVIAGIFKNRVANRFRACFSPPQARHRRVDGGLHRCWEGFAIVGADEK